MTLRSALLVPLAVLLGACTVAGPRLEGPDSPAPTGRVLPEGRMPDVRIGIVVDAPSIRLEGDGELTLTDDGGRVVGRGAGPWTVTRLGNGLEARSATALAAVEGGLVARPDGGRIRVDGTAYHGAIFLRLADGVTAVNLLDLETYLRGVVPMEIGVGRPAEELEAVKAQAVAARTYAVRQLGRRDDLGFDYYGSVLDQAYGGADAEDAAATRAVEETRGMILTYDGAPIEAYYHSTCGGRTAAVEEVWSGDARPYLRSVSDRRPAGGWYCEASSRFRWSEEWDEPALLGALTRGLEGRTGTAVTAVQSLEIAGRGPSGRAAELVIRTDAGVVRVRGDSIRRVLRPEPDRMLNSTAIELTTRGSDRVVGVTVEGSGWGHGIGMCQTGALGRARDGQSYRDILSTYYPGTRLVRLY